MAEGEIREAEPTPSVSAENKVENALRESEGVPVKGESGFKNFIKAYGPKLGITIGSLLLISGVVILKTIEFSLRLLKGALENPANPGNWVQEAWKTFKSQEKK